MENVLVVVVGKMVPGETLAEVADTVQVVDYARFADVLEGRLPDLVACLVGQFFEEEQADCTLLQTVPHRKVV